MSRWLSYASSYEVGKETGAVGRVFKAAVPTDLQQTACLTYCVSELACVSRPTHSFTDAACRHRSDWLSLFDPYLWKPDSQQQVFSFAVVCVSVAL